MGGVGVGMGMGRVLLQAGPAGKDRKAGNNVLIVIPGVHITAQQSASAWNQETDGNVGAPGSECRVWSAGFGAPCSECCVRSALRG